MSRGFQLKTIFFYAIGIAIIMISPSSGYCQQNEIRVVGWLERVLLYPEQILMKAKLDTGAKNSSLHATDIVRFAKGNSVWVRFTITDEKKKKWTLERPMVRTAKIKERNGKHQERPVVEMTVCLGNVRKIAEVNLVNRSKFIYKFLIGRSFLKGNFAVDPNATYTVISDCKKKKSSIPRQD